MCRTGSEAYKRRLVYGVVFIIIAYNSFVPLLRSFIANVLKCKACLESNFKCVCVTMCSLLLSLFSCDYIKAEIDKLKYRQCFNLLKCVQYPHSAWFLDGRTSVLVS